MHGRTQLSLTCLASSPYFKQDPLESLTDSDCSLLPLLNHYITWFVLSKNLMLPSSCHFAFLFLLPGHGLQNLVQVFLYLCITCITVFVHNIYLCVTRYSIYASVFVIVSFFWCGVSNPHHKHSGQILYH